MRLKELPDWSNFHGVGLDLYTLRDAKFSRLRHFIILDIEFQGDQHAKMLEVESAKIERVLSILKVHLGKSLREIAELEIDG